MTRLLRLVIPLLALGLLTSAPAYADTGGPQAAPLSRHLDYAVRIWGDDSVQAPQSWSVAWTNGGQARFHDEARGDLLSIDPLAGRGTPDDRMRARVRALAGTPGLVVTSEQSRVEPRSGQRWATLSYRWRDGGRARVVTVRWMAAGDGTPAWLVLTVAGRPQDADGLRAVLTRAGNTAMMGGSCD